MKNRNLDHKNDWKTPNYIFNYMEYNFGFCKEDYFDPCPFMHDMERDGLNCKRPTKDIFINPPYSLEEKVAFVLKGINHAKETGSRVFMLLPVSTSTKLFHEYILPNKSIIHFLKGRVKFSGWNTKGEWVDNKCGMHDSMIVIF